VLAGERGSGRMAGMEPYYMCMSKAEKIIIALLFLPSPILFCMLIAAVSIFLCDIEDPVVVKHS
jgi:hypothetical protein